VATRGEGVVVRSAGLEVEVPQGWDAEIYRREGEITSQAEGGAGVSHSVVHLGTFPLPPARGDFGSGAVEIMNQDDLLVVLFEYGRESVGSRLFARSGIPRADPEDFSPNNMQRPIAGQSGAQYFFNEVGRAFCLYVVLGSHARRNELIPEVNQVLAGLIIDPE
jgi:hypothetical protein